MIKSILFDIDGTLADVEHRRIHFNQEKADWRSFNNFVGDDAPNKPLVEPYKTLWETKKYELILISGRSEAFRKITK